MATKSKGFLAAPPVKRLTKDWGAGLRFGAKTLSVKSVSRAIKPMDVFQVVLRHCLRQENEDHRHRSPIDKARSALNEVLLGPKGAKVGVELAHNAFVDLGITPARKDAIVAIELVFQPPDGADHPEFWRTCLEWAGRRYPHLLSAVVHRDQRRPHLHAIALAVTDGRLCGNAMSSGANRFVVQRREFMAHVRLTLGLRPDRKVRTLADLALSPGRGPKTKTQADRSDAALVRKVEAERRRVNMGMGVDGHGGLAPETGNPHAQANEATPLLRSLSHVAALWAELFTDRKPLPQNAAIPASAVMAPSAVFEREREDDFSTSSWSTELGEFVASPQAMPTICTARLRADVWVAGELRSRRPLGR